MMKLVKGEYWSQTTFYLYVRLQNTHPFSKSVWILPAAWGAFVPRWIVQARTFEIATKQEKTIKLEDLKYPWLKQKISVE